MEWRDEGLVLATRRHGERDSILEVMTEAHGRHLGLVRGGRSSRIAPMLQPGNRVSLVWRARLEEHLGQFTAETLEARAGQVLASPLALHAVNHLACSCASCPSVNRMSRSMLPRMDSAAFWRTKALLAETLVRFELMILRELGFGLDLEECAATGMRDELVFVSPKSGRAVSREAGEPYAPKLLPLPDFLHSAHPSRRKRRRCPTLLRASASAASFWIATSLNRVRCRPARDGLPSLRFSKLARAAR